MPRVKRGTVRRAKRKKLLGLAKGYYANKSKLYRAAKESVDTALKYAFVGRRRKKRDFRRLWVVRINAAAREHGLTYGQLINGLKNAGVTLDRKSLSELAISSPAAFATLAEQAKARAKTAATRVSRRSRRVARSTVDRDARPRAADYRLVDCRLTTVTRLPTADVHISPDQRLGRSRRLPRSTRTCAAAQSPRDAQAVRDRYLGRKNSVVASWMQLIASAPPDQKKSIGRFANELKQAIEARWTDVSRQRPRDRAPGRRASTSRCPAACRALGHRHPLTIVRDRMEGDLHAHGLRDRRRARDRGRVALLRRAEHAGRASRARHAGHAVPRDADPGRDRPRRRPADAAAHAHLVDADPLHAGAPAADPHRRARAASTAATIST